MSDSSLPANTRTAELLAGSPDAQSVETLLNTLIKMSSPAPSHTAPSLTRQGFQKQAEFNCGILNLLEQAKRDPTQIDSAIDATKERNSLLIMADKNPRLFEAVETAKTFEGTASGSSPLVQAMFIAQSLNQGGDSRKRKASSPPPSTSQPFRQRASAFGSAGAQSYFRPPSILAYQPRFSPPGGNQVNAQAIGPCFGCGQYGHIRPQCRSVTHNRQSAKREAEFVSEEVTRLLESRAIELCANPKVVSPLAVVKGDPACLLTRALLQCISSAQKSGTPLNSRIPLSFDEKGSAGESLRNISDVIKRCDPSLMPVFTNSIENAKAQSTMRAYKGSFAKLRDYARERGLDPACPTSLVIFSLKKIQEGRAISSLRTLSASFSHFVSSPPPFISQILSHLHLSTRRKYTVSHHANVPRSHIDSFVLFANGCPNDVACIRTALGASISFCALLRVSELLALKWDDLNWSNVLLRVSVNKAKNDQFELGRETFVAVDNDSPTLALFHHYRSVVPVSPWLFPSLSNPEVPIKSDTFRQDLALLCLKTGIDKITPHQLRAGGAMESIRRGTSIEEVQRRGRWNSAAGLSPYLSDTIESQGGALPL
ncbi:hypothetical protein PRIPAC_91543 [Pristionchus pacificus]|nr:hypothetical protein PRIPAC_91543 [Pristionchus pacificus]|eukprot:PDM62812.1 hypothetical protein PRIPAC_50027 [Pristionchus pacificus]